MLLNRVGRTASNPVGFADSGLDVSFDDAAANGDIHVYRAVTNPPAGTPLTGTWQPDGRLADPAVVLDTADVRKLLDKEGAVFVDTRYPGEFKSDHLPNAINIPLGDLKTQIPLKVPDKGQVLLLHCLSGGRSAMGQRTLRSMGYKRAFNLGSYNRAERIVTSAK